MKKVIFFLFIALQFPFHSFGQEPNDVKINAIAQKIANAHGIENWQKVAQIEFTFNVDKDTTHSERSWVWQPKSNDITLITKKDSIHFNPSNLSTEDIKQDKKFINDKFWLLIPFQLVWDQGTSISEPIVATAPVSKSKMNKITLTYPSEGGGYTPGDAYDLYFEDDFLIKEWTFRRGNQEKPSLVNTFENYQDFNGIKLALEHKRATDNWNLYFSNVKVTTE